MSDFATRRTTMVDTQIRPSDVTKFPIIDAMLSVPREAFVPDEMREAAYAGTQLDLGGRKVLEPRCFAKMLDALNVGPEDLVLDLGCGLGYSSAVLAHMAEAVVAVEEDADMATDAQNRLAEAGVTNVAVLDGQLSDGAAKHAPYDAIIIEGGVQDLPDSLIAQLKEGGRLAVIFQVGALGTVRIGHKAGGNLTWQDVFNAEAPVLAGFERAAEFQL